MIIQILTNIFYAPNVLQNRLPDELGYIIIAIGVLAPVIHWSVRHINPPTKKAH